MLLRMKRVPRKMDADDQPTFEEWLARVNRVVVRCCGINIQDLSFCPYQNWYADRLRPVRAAQRVLKNCVAG